jgi:hypothetical protein
MKKTGKNITFYASAEALEKIENLRTGEKSNFISEAILAYGRIGEIERRVDTVMKASLVAYVQTTGRTLEDLASDYVE